MRVSECRSHKQEKKHKRNTKIKLRNGGSAVNMLTVQKPQKDRVVHGIAFGSKLLSTREILRFQVNHLQNLCGNNHESHLVA